MVKSLYFIAFVIWPHLNSSANFTKLHGSLSSSERMSVMHNNKLDQFLHLDQTQTRQPWLKTD